MTDTHVPSSSSPQVLPLNATSPSAEALSAELAGARAALHGLQQEFQAVLAVVTDLVIMLDADGRYLAIRDGSPELLARPPETLLGRTLHEVLPPALAEQSLNTINESLIHHRRVTIEYSLDLPARTWFEAHVFPIDERRVISLVRNITPRKLAELEIARYAERLRTLHEIDQSILAARSPATIALAALGRLRRMIACQRVTAVEFDATENISVLSVEAEQEFSTAMQQRVALLNREGLKQGRAQGVEDLASLAQRSPLQELLFQDGIRAYVAIPMLVHVELIGALLLEAAHQRAFTAENLDVAFEVAAMLGIAIRQARLYAAVEQRAEQLARATQLAQEALINAEAANHAKSAFLANVTHELRTPLNAILGFVQLMAQQPDLSAEQRENLATIGHSGEHLLGLINNVLELSKIEAGRTPLQEQDFDLLRLLRDLREMFQQRAKKQDLRLIFEWGQEVPRFVHLDQGKLRQILINLLDNAIKFTPTGHVILRVAATTNLPSAEQGLLHFEVEDTGPGIPFEEQQNIFTPFVQAAPLPHTAPGTGLGLAISQQLARLLDSEITLQHHAGAGCLFVLNVRYALTSPDAMQNLQAEALASETLGAIYAEPVAAQITSTEGAAEDEAATISRVLLTLPPEWRSALRKATINADVRLILEYIEQINAAHPALAHKLRQLAHDYDHDTILTLLHN